LSIASRAASVAGSATEPEGAVEERRAPRRLEGGAERASDLRLLLAAQEAAERFELTELGRRDHAASRRLSREGNTFSDLQNAPTGVAE